tara:strand:- start:99 stop:884 length:786 start_codon:yes stop_codon:yes gene_type:complete
MRHKKEIVNTVYIGYDEKEDTAYEVLKFSLERIATKPIRVVPIKKNLIERMGIYTRKSNMIHGQQYDEIDGKPFSTEFSFSRFLVPALNMYQGYALYMDCDMYIRADVNELFELCENSYYPLWCVKHKYEPKKGIKMDGKEQQPYPRKNWSSLMMFNCSHEVNEKLTPEAVNTKSGRWLHTFQWLPDKEADIGTIPEEWNWLDNHSSEDIEAKNVHFTTGGPWFNKWGSSREKDTKYAVEWSNDADWLQIRGLIDNKDYMI